MFANKTYNFKPQCEKYSRGKNQFLNFHRNKPRKHFFGQKINFSPNEYRQNIFGLFLLKQLQIIFADEYVKYEKKIMKDTGNK